MKIAAKITAGIVAFLLLIPVAGVVLLQLPSVQNAITDGAVAMIGQKTDASIEIGNLHYALFDRILLEEITVCDKGNPEDTLLACRKAALAFQPMSFLKGEYRIRRLALRDGAISLKKSADGILNVSGLFPARNGDAEDDKDAGTMPRKPQKPLDISLQRLLIDNFRVRYVNEGFVPSPKTPCPTTINFGDVRLSDIHVDLRDLKWCGATARAEVEQIRLREANGFELRDLKFAASYDSSGVRITNFYLADNFSRAQLDYVNLGFDNFGQFRHFTDSVRIEALFNDTGFSLETVQSFAPGISTLQLFLGIDGKVHGTVSDLYCDSLRVSSLSGETVINVDAHLYGLPDANSTMASLNISDCWTNTADLAEIVYQCTASKETFRKSSVSKLAPGTTFHFKGSLNGFFEDFVAYGAVTSDIGGAKVDLLCRNQRRVGYDVIGSFDAREFDLGHFLQNKSLGRLSCHGAVSGFAANVRHSEGESELFIDDISISKLDFNDYCYSNISASGIFRGSEFDGRIVAADPNLKFMMQGILALSGKTGNDLYRLKLSLGHADLAALNFDKREISTIRLNADADFTHTTRGSYIGRISISDIICHSPEGYHDLGDIVIKSFSGGDRYSVRVESDLLEASYRGSAFITTAFEEVKGAFLRGKLDNLAHRMAKTPECGPDSYDLSLKVLEAQPLLSYLAPTVHIDRGTSLHLSSPGDSTAKVTLQSKLVGAGGIFIKDLRADILSGRENLTATVTSSLAKSGVIEGYRDTIKAYCASNSILASICYNNAPDNNGQLKAMVSFPNLKETDQKMFVHLGQSYFNLNGMVWNINPASAYIADRHIIINDFSISCDDQSINIDGILSESLDDHANFSVKDFNLSFIDKISKSPLGIGGTLSLDGVMSGAFAKPELRASVNADSLCLAGKEIGSLALSSAWDDSNGRLAINAGNTLRGRSPLSIKGYYAPASDSLMIRAVADRFALEVIEPFTKGVVDNVSGTISGAITAEGHLKEPSITADEIKLNDLKARLIYTNVPYTISGTLRMDDNRIAFNNLKLRDEEGNTGEISGGIAHNHLKGFEMGIDIKADNLLGFNTTINDNDVFYGKAYATGNVKLTGPMDHLLLDIDARTGPKTVVNIPLKSAGIAQTSIITFVNNEIAPRLSGIDSLMSLGDSRTSANKKTASTNTFWTDIRIHATDDAQLNLEIDSNSGDALRVRGSGTVDLAIHDDFSIKGDYTVSEGSYRLALLGIVTRDFSIDPGGTINFNGDIMQSDLNMTASYKTKASVANLVADSTSTSLRRPITCGIELSDKLANPKLGFTIDVADLDPSTKGRVDNALNTEEKRMRQFLALILSGAFIPDEQSGIVNNTSVSYFNASEIMTSQLNSIFQELGIPLDLGFNYQPGIGGKDIFDVAVSTQLINNRVSINGNIGNRRYLTNSKNDIMGDIDVEVKLDKKGRLKLNLFSHAADQYSNYLDQSQRNGAGVAYQEEFNTVKELWRKYTRRGKGKNREGIQAEE
ncbi:MAG: translocation/assembly module TamB domain-containing protein [Bacteroidales bacterium]|nr:translocation/assembly module TamB domain-containing protein [Bacteroidales bacterium]